MEKENLIIGGVSNYGYEQMKVWVESINMVCPPNTRKVLVISNISSDTQKILLSKGFELIQLPEMNMPIHVARFLGIYEYLKNRYKQFEYVITTDVKDVYFQSNPFEFIDFNFGNNDLRLIAGSESIRYKDEPWGDQNLRQAYGEYVYNIFKENEIYNVGVLAGYSEYIKDLVFNIVTNAVNRPIPIVDQAVFNVLIQTQPYKDITLFTPQYMGWAVQAGTVADPSKMDQFRPKLTEREPRFVNGEVVTHYGKKFCIVHQYDRVPEWKEQIYKKFEVEIDEPKFVYRS